MNELQDIADYRIRIDAAQMVQQLIIVKYTQKRLAELLEISVETVNKIKNNKYPSVISAKTYKRLEFLTNDYNQRAFFE